MILPSIYGVKDDGFAINPEVSVEARAKKVNLNDVFKIGVTQSYIPEGNIAPKAYGLILPTHSNFIYNRVHVKPSRIDLSNLLSQQTRRVEVWSAYYSIKRLASIDSFGIDGITLEQPEAAPVDFGFLESKIYTVKISTEGAPVIDGGYRFNFDTEQPILYITGKRVVAFPFMYENTHKETLRFKTTIASSRTQEKRAALRSTPRTLLSFEYILNAEEFSHAKILCNQWVSRLWALPLFAQSVLVENLPAGSAAIPIDTRFIEFRSFDLVMVWADYNNFAVYETAEVEPDKIKLKYPTAENWDQVYVAPVKFGHTIDGIKFERLSNRYSKATATFQVDKEVDLGGNVGNRLYRGVEILEHCQSLTGQRSNDISAHLEVFDDGISSPHLISVKSYLNVSDVLSFTPKSLEESYRLRKWLYFKKGSQKSFWVPSWNKDLTLIRKFFSADSAITVKTVGYSQYGGEKDVYIVLKDKSVFVSRIIGAAAVDGGESLILDNPPKIDIEVSDVLIISFLRHARIASDEITLTHTFNGVYNTSIPIVETPEGAV